MIEISVISPVYRAEKIVDELVKRVCNELEKITPNYEFIMVEDGSPDNSWDVIVRNCKNNPKVKGIKLSRNFGQHYAITAGVASAKGESIVLLDCDLQDDPSYINSFIQKRKEGFDIVFSKRINRKHGFIKSLNSKIYNSLFSIFSDGKFDVDAGSFVCFSHRVKDAFIRLEDKDRLYLQLLKWIGFKSTYIELEHNERFDGKSSYTIYKLIKLGLQGWTSHSDKLLRMSIGIGLSISALSFITAIAIVIGYLFYNLQPGWPSIIVSIFFSTGLILMSIGIAGIYIGKIFDQVKNRPLYIIEEKLND
jgi:dolichol-phosphate mannosyltransferase